jgi:ATP-binding cassette subfamily C protein LapB
LRRQWDADADAAALAGHEVRQTQAMTANGAALVLQLVTVLTLVGGAYAVSASVMTVGGLSACLMLVGRAVTPLSALLMQAVRLRQLARTMAPLADLASRAEESGGDASDAGRAAPAIGAVSVSRLSFSYPEATRPALDGLSLTLRPGERVALVGRSGCGKSSLLRLLARLHEPTAGTIHVDGRDIRQIDPADLRRAVALMGQDPHLFDASLEANLTAGLQGVAPDWFRQVAALSGVADIAARSAEGFSLGCGSGGARLSGGERQQVALARALMGRPRLLLLDEPTSAMDNERENRLVRALGQELARAPGEGIGGSGLVVATHRLSILALVDRVICLDAGRIVADGPKEQVLRQLGAAA